jgi:hypothetical protein
MNLEVYVMQNLVLVNPNNPGHPDTNPSSYIETYKKIRYDKFRASKLPIKQC